MQDVDVKVESTLQAYINDSEPQFVKLDPPIDLRELAAELRALPILLDMGGCYWLRSDGEIFSSIWDEPRELRVEGEERIRNLVLFQAVRKFPELEPLMPKRPATAQDCDFCRGTGIVNELPPELAKDVLCFCGGLGWLP